MTSLVKEAPKVNPIRPAVRPSIRHGGVRVVEKLSDGSLLVAIRSETKKGTVSGFYNVSRIPSDFGDGFALVQIPAEGAGTAEVETRHVHLDDTGSSCTCPDAVYRSSFCKHLASITALVNAGRI